MSFFESKCVHARTCRMAQVRPSEPIHSAQPSRRASTAYGVTLFALFTLGAVLPALAQNTQPAKAASTPAGEVSEAVRRQALGPYRFILNNANAASKARPAVTPTPTVPEAAPPAVTAARRQAPKSGLATGAGADSAPSPTPSISTADTSPAADAEALAPATAAVPVVVPALSSTGSAANASPAVATPVVARQAAQRPLVAIRQDAPILNGTLLREGVSGVVKVAFEVKPDGSTGDIKVASSTNRRLNSTAMAAVAKWLFQPIEASRPLEIDLVFSSE